jgi:hypothetical protein
LRKDEDPVSVRSESLEEFVEENHLARVENETAQDFWQRLVAVFGPVEQVRVVSE